VSHKSTDIIVLSAHNKGMHHTDSVGSLSKLPHTTHHRWRRRNNRFVWIRRHPLRAVIVGLVTALLLFLVGKKLLSLVLGRRHWQFAPIVYLNRPCPAPPYPVIDVKQQQQQQQRPRICLTSLTDEHAHGPLHWLVQWRNYNHQVASWSRQNKQRYADKHGYTFVDASYLLNASRPPAWTKVLALQHLLQRTGEKEHCDWVVWMDADAIIMNANIRIESFLPIHGDLLTTMDKPHGGWNSGSLVFRNSEWSKQFLNDWWNMEDYVRPAGFSLSGDNNAFKQRIRTVLEDPHQTHVRVPARCTFNSFATFVQKAPTPNELQSMPWYRSQHHYHAGDFVAHVAGYDNKVDTVRLLVQEEERLRVLRELDEREGESGGVLFIEQERQERVTRRLREVQKEEETMDRRESGDESEGMETS